MSRDQYRHAPRCYYHVRTAVPGGFRYETLAAQDMTQGMRFPYAPSVGDLIHWAGGTYRVVERAWHPNHYGSANWPPGSEHPIMGPMVDMIVELDSGPFRNEVTDDAT